MQNHRNATPRQRCRIWLSSAAGISSIPATACLRTHLDPPAHCHAAAPHEPRSPTDGTAAHTHSPENHASAGWDFRSNFSSIRASPCLRFSVDPRGYGSAAHWSEHGRDPAGERNCVVASDARHHLDCANRIPVPRPFYAEKGWRATGRPWRLADAAARTWRWRVRSSVMAAPRSSGVPTLSRRTRPG